MLDSLRVLPKARQEANEWRNSAVKAINATDSLTAAANRAIAATDTLQEALRGKDVLLLNESSKATEYKQKAHRRGFAVVVLVLVDIAVALLLITH